MPRKPTQKQRDCRAERSCYFENEYAYLTDSTTNSENDELPKHYIYKKVSWTSKYFGI